MVSENHEECFATVVAQNCFGVNLITVINAVFFQLLPKFSQLHQVKFRVLQEARTRFSVGFRLQKAVLLMVRGDRRPSRIFAHNLEARLHKLVVAEQSMVLVQNCNFLLLMQIKHQ